MITTVEDALAIAKNLHYNQTYGRSDRDYYGHHIVPVTSLAMRIAEAEPNVDPVVVGMTAALHDTIEDVHVSMGDLSLLNVPQEVIDNVFWLTEFTDPDSGLTKRESRDAYIEKAIQRNIVCRIVKLADNLVNSDPVNLAILGADQATRLGEKYRLDRAVMAASWSE